MASWYFGVNRGLVQNPQQVTVGTSSGSTDIELRVDTGKSSTKEDVILALNTFRNYLLTNGVGTTGGTGVDIPPN